MIDSTREEPLTLSQAAKILPCRRQGKSCNPSTLYRWAKKGLGGVRLETIVVGGTTCTTREALQRFYEQLTQKRRATSPASSRETRERRAAAALRKLGL